MTTLREKLASLPKERQERIAAGTAKLIAQEMTLCELRRLMGLTQTQMAQTLNIKQSGLSNLEKRTDLYLSTLRNFIAAIGGNLVLVAEFPDRRPVVIKGLVPLEIDDPTAKEHETAGLREAV